MTTRTVALFWCSYLLLLFDLRIENFFGAYGLPPSTTPDQKCAIPATFVDKTVSFKCKGEAGKTCYKNGDTAVPQYTTATFECKSGYVRDEGKKFQSICLESEWEPSISNCMKRCEKLNPINVDLKCTYRGSSVECDGNLLPDTRVRPTCQPLHTYEDSAPAYEEIICKADGKWDHGLFACVPDCGRRFVYAEPLIAFGEPEKYGDSPWNVAIYNKNSVLICGGTIVSPRLVLSAAHCFYDQKNRIKEDANNYEIIVSKVTRNSTVRDNGNQKNYKVKEIRFSKNGFVGSENYYASNIALLILTEEITMGPTVMPACVDWTGTKKIPPSEGTAEKVVGWGLDENKKLSETLRTANLPYISHEQCLKLLKDADKQYLTIDKFCAGNEKGATAQQGDSGGGLMFQEKNRYYIRGIVSTKPTASWVVMFTDLNTHIDWILSVRNEVEPSIIKKEITLGFKNKKQ